jgi:hypothetical protein
MPCIALVTDFGTRDPYVAAMKGVIATRTSATIHDLTHEIAPFDVLEAAWFLKTVAPYWAEGTIFVCVVDPGVGTSRKIVAAEVDGRMFLAPDNGLLTFVASRTAGVPPALAGHRARPSGITAGRDARRDAGGAPAVRAYSVEGRDLFLGSISATFHGRDRFAPVAAAIANGMPIDELGPAIEITRLPYDPPTYGQVVHGSIVAIDRFGNAITDIEAARLNRPFKLRVRNLFIDRIEETYADAAPGPFLIVGSSGFVEISIANASAAERLQLRRLERIELWQNENGAADS